MSNDNDNYNYNDNLKLIFFQNCISPHQMPYIEMLSKRDDVEHVWVIAPRLAYSERAAMGWPETWKNSSKKLSILVNPIDQDIETLLHSTPLCFFSGITAFPEVFHWFKLSLKYDVKRGIITEAPYTYDKPLWMHKIKFVLKDYRYIKYVDYVFAIGEDCAEYYQGWSKSWKVVPFLYCTEFKSHTELTDSLGFKPNGENLTDCLNLVFVGSLDRRKNVKVLLEALSLVGSHSEIKSHTELTDHTDFNVTIVGDGPEHSLLEEKAKIVGSNIRVEFRGALPMEETQKVIAENDVLVLPSLHDGWGAVINEAMTLGTIPVCSDKCGAKAIIKKSGFGGVFDVNNPLQLTEMLTGFAKNLDSLRKERKSRIVWAKDNISPIAVSEYFISSLT